MIVVIFRHFHGQYLGWYYCNPLPAMKMKKSRKRLLITTGILLTLGAVFGLLVYYPSVISRTPFSTPETSFGSWEEIFASPKPISIETYSTGNMETDLSGIMNLDHPGAAGIEDEVVNIPVTVSVVQHQEQGAYLIDAGLDASYVHNPYGTVKGLMAKNLGRGSQEPNTHIAAILQREGIQIKGVWLTHMHPDHTAGIIDLPKDIPYVVGEGERYLNFRFFMETDHLAGIDELHEIDFEQGVDLPPFGKCIDLFGDGSFWAIETSGHSKGHVMYLINALEGPVLVTGDACNDQYQFDTGVGPGYFSSDKEKAQEVLETLIGFKERYPQVRLVYGHDL